MEAKRYVNDILKCWKKKNKPDSLEFFSENIHQELRW